MTDDKIRVLSSRAEVRFVSVHFSSILSSNLGGLRQLVEACEGMPDDANVWVEELTRNDGRPAVYWFKKLCVEERKKMS